MQLEEKGSGLRGQIVTLPAHSEADLNHLREKNLKVKAERQKILENKQEKSRLKEMHGSVVHWQHNRAAMLRDVGDLCEHLK